MSCASCKKKKLVSLPPLTDDKLLSLTKEEKIERTEDLNRLIYLLDSKNFRSSEGEFIGLYRKVFGINLPAHIPNQMIIRDFIFTYKNNNIDLLTK